MKRAIIAGGTVAAVAVLAVALAYRAFERDPRPPEATSPATAPSPPSAPAEPHPAAETQGFLYGRITAADGSTYEGRLRWGAGGQEAFWGDYFNGAKSENPWVAYAPPERFKERHTISILGLKLGERTREIDVRRLFMARFGDITRIEASGRDVRVTLKSGAEFVLDRLEASDFDDGVRVWDGARGVVDLDSLQIRAIELLPTPTLGDAPGRLHGTVRTRRGDFTGFVQWEREACVGSDELEGRNAEGRHRLRFDTIRSIARRPNDGFAVTRLDGREIALAVGHWNKGIYVDDRRFGRVLVSWNAFERLDFSPGGSGPAYGDFPPGRPLTGSVTTRSGARLTGRLVYDLDETETTETLDAPFRGVDYTIPFGQVASIVPGGRGERARVTPHDGEELELERSGDLGDRNAGMLIFLDGRERPEYVPWTDVERIDFAR